MTESEKNEAEKLEREYVKVKNFKAFKNKSREEIIARLKEIKEKKAAEAEYGEENEMDIGYMFIDNTEKTRAYKLLKKYLETFSIENISDKNTLKLLIYYEIIVKRIQGIINEKHKAKKDSFKLMEEMNRMVDKITQLKGILGLANTKESNDSYEALELLKKKATIWRSENQGSRTIACPYCGQMVLLKIRTDKWESAKHPFFKDRVLTNKHLLKLYKEKKLTREDISLVLECSPDYIDWILKKHYYGVNALS